MISGGLLISLYHSILWPVVVIMHYERRKNNWQVPNHIENILQQLLLEKRCPLCDFAENQNEVESCPDYVDTHHYGKEDRNLIKLFFYYRVTILYSFKLRVSIAKAKNYVKGGNEEADLSCNTESFPPILYRSFIVWTGVTSGKFVNYYELDCHERNHH